MTALPKNMRATAWLYEPDSSPQCACLGRILSRAESTGAFSCFSGQARVRLSCRYFDLKIAYFGIFQAIAYGIAFWGGEIKSARADQDIICGPWHSYSTLILVVAKPEEFLL